MGNKRNRISEPKSATPTPSASLWVVEVRGSISADFIRYEVRATGEGDALNRAVELASDDDRIHHVLDVKTPILARRHERYNRDPSGR